MQRIIYTVLAAFFMALILGPIMIPRLKRMKFGQTINDLGPQSHKVKQGTPTMGGIILAVPALIAALIFVVPGADLQIILMPFVCMLGFGAIGFIDDYIKVKKKRSLGLTPKQKLVPQIILSIGLGVWAYLHPMIGSSLVVPSSSFRPLNRKPLNSISSTKPISSIVGTPYNCFVLLNTSGKPSHRLPVHSIHIGMKYRYLAVFFGHEVRPCFFST